VDARTDPIAGAQNPSQGNYIGTQIAIIQSERVAMGVVEKLHLVDQPEFVARWKAATQEKEPLDKFYVNLLRKGLEVEPPRGTNVIRLNFEWSDPQFAADVVNWFSQVYLDLNVDLRVEPAREYAGWFDDRVKTLRKNFEAAQAKLSAFQRSRGIVGNDQRADQETQRLDQLMTQLVAVQGENIAVSSRQSTSGSDISPDVQASNTVQGLKSEVAKAESKLAELSVQLGPNHPQRLQLEGQLAVLRKQLADEVRRVTGGTNLAQSSASLRENELRAVIAAQKEKVLSLRQQQDQMAVLVQDVEAAKRIYDSVLQRSNELNLEKQTDKATVSVLSMATVPTAAAKPNVPKYIAMAFAAAIAGAVIAALGVEFLDSKVRVVEDIMLEDVPVLGVIERKKGTLGLEDRFGLSKKFFVKRKAPEEVAATSRLGSLS
jgi:chain length determinant protein EpsF